MKTLGQILLVVGAVILAYILYAFWPEIRHATRTGDPQRITAEVRLNNRCGMPDTNFVMQDLKTRRSSPFSNGVARITVMEGDYLELQLSARYSTDGSMGKAGIGKWLAYYNGERQHSKRSMRGGEW